MTSATAQPVNGQDINVAAQAVRSVLEVVLAEAGTTFPPFATMNTLAARGPQVTRDALVAEIASGLQVDEATVRAILRGLQSRGLVTRTSGPDSSVRVEFTPEGEAEHRRLRTLVQAATVDLYKELDPEALATTRLVLVALA